MYSQHTRLFHLFGIEIDKHLYESIKQIASNKIKEKIVAVLIIKFIKKNEYITNFLSTYAILECRMLMVKLKKHLRRHSYSEVNLSILL